MHTPLCVPSTLCSAAPPWSSFPTTHERAPIEQDVALTPPTNSEVDARVDDSIPLDTIFTPALIQVHPGMRLHCMCVRHDGWPVTAWGANRSACGKAIYIQHPIFQVLRHVFNLCKSCNPRRADNALSIHRSVRNGVVACQSEDSKVGLCEPMWIALSANEIGPVRSHAFAAWVQRTQHTEVKCARVKPMDSTWVSGQWSVVSNGHMDMEGA